MNSFQVICTYKRQGSIWLPCFFYSLAPNDLIIFFIFYSNTGKNIVIDINKMVFTAGFSKRHLRRPSAINI